VPATAVVGAVWMLPADAQWSALALFAAAVICAWQVR